MKKLLPVLVVITSTLTAHAQGTVNFANRYIGVNAPVYESDAVTPLSGSQFMVQLFAGPSANSLASIAMTGFSTGVDSGYFFGGVETINSVFGGATAWVQVDIWNTASGASFSQAQNSGLPNSWWESSVFTVQTGNPFGLPSLPGPLTGLGTSPLFLNSVPEPSTLALVGLGLVGMLILRLRTCERQAAGLNESRQPTPEERSRLCFAPAARRGCVLC